jgi:hypothetical protein
MWISGVKMLATDVLTEEDVLGQKRKLITVGSRAVNQVAGVYGARELPLLQAANPMARLYMRKAHERGHEGTVSSLHGLRRDVWIVSHRSLAETTRTSWTECRLKEKKCMSQRMGPLPNRRVGPGPVFQSVTVDLFGPIEYQATVNKRQIRKGWGVMFVCLATSVAHVEFMDTYLTDSFLMALCQFM